jgi:hypothetical protein
LMGYDRMLNIDYRGQAASILSNAAKSVSQACGFVGNIWPAALS